MVKHEKDKTLAPVIQNFEGEMGNSCVNKQGTDRRIGSVKEIISVTDGELLGEVALQTG